MYLYICIYIYVNMYDFICIEVRMYKVMICGLADTTDVSKDTYMYEKRPTK